VTGPVLMLPAVVIVSVYVLAVEENVVRIRPSRP
jgi:hypothetical protein